MQVRKRAALLVAVFLLAGCTNSAFSQTSSTSLRGTVLDPSDSVVAQATVVLENTESNIKRQVLGISVYPRPLR